MVAAGYVLYGTSTLLVYTTGRGVNGFTLDPTIGEFCLSHKDIRIPARGNYYSVNQGYYLKFDVEMRRFIDHCSDLNLRLRYIGSMVSDSVSGRDFFVSQHAKVSFWQTTAGV